MVTCNARDFQAASLEAWGIEIQGPSTFLINLYDLAPGIVARKLSEHAQTIGLSSEALLLKLQVNVPIMRVKRMESANGVRATW